MIKTIPDEISYLTNLHSLLFDNNLIKKIPESWSSLGNLRRLYLENNEIYNLPNELISLINNNHLLHVDSRNNNITVSLEMLNNINPNNINLRNNDFQPPYDYAKDLFELNSN